MTSTSLATKYVRSLTEFIILFDTFVEKGRLTSKWLGRPGPATLFSKVEDELNDITLEEEVARWIPGQEVASVA